MTFSRTGRRSWFLRLITHNRLWSSHPRHASPQSLLLNQGVVIILPFTLQFTSELVLKGGRVLVCVFTLLTIIPDICHFFTRAKLLENKIYTEKMRKL